jgi:hypothetical protein|tara:strand:+ start:235 stop:513 length:279 start_codon:yes stop_codon:yes gene_type:complete
MSYYNTTNLKGSTLKNSRKKAKTQEDLILAWFKKHKRAYTPCEVRDKVLRDSPLTSVRRAMTNLTEKGYLIKTTLTKMGKYGKFNYCWKYNK